MKANNLNTSAGGTEPIRSFSPVAHETNEKYDPFVSVMRSSYCSHHIPPVPLASSIRREKAIQVNKDMRTHSPPFKASTNYDMSFTNSVTPAPQQSLRPDVREQKHLPFKSTSTNRASYRSPSPTDFPSRVSKKEQGTIKPLAFSATSESRKVFVNYNIEKVPPRKKEEHRPLPKTHFAAQSVMHSDFVQFSKEATNACHPHASQHKR